MHIWFLHKRLINDRIDPHFALLIQEELFDILWLDTTQRIRAQGVNELTVNKHLKDVQEYTFLHLTHYDHVYSDYEIDDPERYIELSGLVWIHLLLKDEVVHDDHLKRLVAYIDAQYENIMHHLPDEYFWEGRVGWVNIPSFSGMRDIKGDPLEKIPVNPEDVLPEGWHVELNNAGKPYYWNEKATKSQWERPTFT
jgi:cytochrome b pre-mRNA-processing protein 3